MKTNIRFFIIVLVFVCLVLLPKAQAIVPPPDGGYPGGNTAEGQNALLSLTTGGFNTAVGFLSLRSNTTGAFNTAVGAGTLLANMADGNTATGSGALLSNLTGTFNTADGAFALLSNTTGGDNTANGVQALALNTTGSENTANGSNALYSNTTGSANTATGFAALFANTAGVSNTATGYLALRNNTTGNENTANGSYALIRNTTGGFNTATGWRALESNTTGVYNTATGFQALLNNTEGSYNTAVGVGAGAGVSTADNVICIGSSVFGADVSNSCFIGNIFGVTSSGGTGVFVNSAGQLGISTSSQRFKDDIKPMDQASEVILALKPVTFHYKRDVDPQGIPQFGLVAEEVEKVSPDLVVRDAQGKVNTVRYDAVNAMLLNEFLKEHQTVQELKSQL